MSLRKTRDHLDLGVSTSLSLLHYLSSPKHDCFELVIGHVQDNVPQPHVRIVSVGTPVSRRCHVNGFLSLTVAFLVAGTMLLDSTRFIMSFPGLCLRPRRLNRRGRW